MNIEINKRKGGGKLREREEFIKALNNYYQHLSKRFNNGYDYCSKNTDDKKAIQVYEHLIKELATIEAVKNFYDR